MPIKKKKEIFAISSLTFTWRNVFIVHFADEKTDVKRKKIIFYHLDPKSLKMA